MSSNTVEGFFSIVKRGLIGTYHHVDGQHLCRYLDEFDFRYNTRDITDAKRMMVALKGTEGERFYYCQLLSEPLSARYPGLLENPRE